MARQVDQAALREFVAKRRKATGGYGATPRLPATIQDTFQAVAITLLLGEEPPTPQAEPALAGYLTRMLGVPWLGIDTTFRLLFTCRLCGLAVDGERVRAHLAACLARDASLAASYYASRIAGEILGEGPDLLGPGRLPALPARQAVEEAARHLFVQAMGGRLLGGAAELTGWLQRAQNGDGGFGFFPGTTSFVENCHAALAALSLLGARPSDPANARAFLLGCQTGGGGFGRSPRAAPFLDASWHALAGLRLLEEMEAHPAGGVPEISSQMSRLLLSV